MDFSLIVTRDDIFKYRITASFLISISSQITDEDREIIRNNMGEIWIPYTYGRDSVTSKVSKMPFYNFLMLYGDQGDIQGVKKYCSQHIDILNRTYNNYIGKLFISRYGTNDPISKVIKMFIYDNTQYKIEDNIIYYNTTRGEKYVITPMVLDNVELISQYMPRRTIKCNNGDIILKTGFCFFYNCVPLGYYEEYPDSIDIIDTEGNFHNLILENGIVTSGYENLPAVFRVRNHSIMDVYDIYRLIKLGMNCNTLIRDYGFDYRVVSYLDTILGIEVCKSGFIIKYKNGTINTEIDMMDITTIIETDDGMYSITYKGKTVMYVFHDFVNFIPITYDKVMDIDGYAIIFERGQKGRILGKTYAM